jgi:hypothetical protein
MTKGFLAALAGLCMAGGMAVAQAPRPAPAAETGVPGLSTAGGTAMAQTPAAPSAAPDPQPVKDAPPSCATPPILEDCNPCRPKCSVCGPPGRVWVSAEYLYWWTKDSRLPPLVTRGSPTDAIPGAIGQPGTRVLFGGDVDGEGRSGGRFEAGFWLNECQTIGFEAGYFFLGSRSNSFVASGSGAPGSPVIARPFLDIPPTGAAPFQNSELVAFPGAAAGTISVQNTSRLQGAAPNALFNLCCSRCDNCCDDCCGGWRFDLIGGFRWMQLNESVTITENIAPSSNLGSSFPAGSHVAVTDQFSTQNDFYGGQIGVRGEWWGDRLFFNARALVALGTTQERATINGTTIFTPAVGAPVVTSGGLLALPSNIGSHSRDAFSVIPEVGINVGYQVTPHLRAFAGYTFMYWSNVVRPGDAIDTGVNPSQLPTSSGRGPLVGPARPAFDFHDSGFWAQGISAGIELRY